MTLTTPISANPRSLCRCTIPDFFELQHLCFQASNIAARICTFHSYFKSRVFNPRLSHSEQVLCFVQMQNAGEGRYPCSKAKVQRFPIVARHSPTRFGRPDTSGLAIGARPGRRSRFHRDRFRNPFRFHAYEEFLPKSFESHAYEFELP